MRSIIVMIPSSSEQWAVLLAYAILPGAFTYLLLSNLEFLIILPHLFFQALYFRLLLFYKRMKLFYLRVLVEYYENRQHDG